MTRKTQGTSELQNLDSMLPDLEALYKDIHAHPELSMQETRTAGMAAERLRAAGYEVAASVGKTGVVGLLRNGDGPVVMLRADMDALPVRRRQTCRMPARSRPPTPRGRPCRWRTPAATIYT